MPIYFDNATTSFPKPEDVYRTLDNTFRNIGGSASRSGHSMGYKADRLLFDTRELIAKFFNIPQSKNIIFTHNATEALNIAIKGVLKSGDHAITTSMDHNAVIRPLAGLAKHNISFTLVPCSSTGTLDPSDIKKSLNKNTRLIIATHASNIIGTINPVKEIGKIACENEIPFLLDAAQTAGHIPIDVQKDNIDLLACTGHKALLGPQGSGFLYISDNIDIEPLIEGGTGSVSELTTQPVFLPDKFESGTLNTPGIAGLGAGIKFILDQKIENIYNHESTLTERLLSGLKGLNGIKLYGEVDTKNRTPAISFTVEKTDPADVGNILNERYGLLCRVGLHCAPNAHKTIGTFPVGTIRVSHGYFTTIDEIDYLIDSIKKIAS